MGVNGGASAKASSNTSFIGPISIKNAPKNMSGSERARAATFDTDGDGVVDYLFIDSESPYNKIEYYIENNMTDADIFKDIMEYNNKVGNIYTPQQINTIFNNVKVSMRDYNNNASISQPPENTPTYDIAMKNFMPSDDASNYSIENRMNSRWKIDYVPTDDATKEKLREDQNEINEERKKLEAIRNAKKEFIIFAEKAASAPNGQPISWVYNGVVLGTFVGGSAGVSKINQFENSLSKDLSEQQNLVDTMENDLLDYKKLLFRLKYTELTKRESYQDFRKRFNKNTILSYAIAVVENTSFSGHSPLGYGSGRYEIDGVNIDYMTDEEKTMYCYLFQTDGKQAASDYLFYIKELVNQREALKNFEERKAQLKTDENGRPITLNNFDDDETNIYNLWCTLTNNLVIDGYALGDGVDTMFQNLCCTISDDGNRTVLDYEKLYFIDYLIEKAPDLAKKYNVIEKFGEAVIPIVASILVSVVTKNPDLGTTALTIIDGVLKAGSTIHSTKVKGINDAIAYSDAIAAGLSTYVANKILTRFVVNLINLDEDNLKIIVKMLTLSTSKTISKGFQAYLDELVEGKMIDMAKLKGEEIEYFLKSLLIGCIAKGVGFVVKTYNGKTIHISKEMTEALTKKYLSSPDTGLADLINQHLGFNVDIKSSYINIS